MATCGVKLRLIVALLVPHIGCSSYDIPREPGAIAAHTFVGACAQNDIAQVKASLRQGIDVNVRDPRFGRTCLQVASYEGHYAVAEFVLSQKADVAYQDEQQMTALYYSVYVARNTKPATYDRRIVELLLKHGANKTVNIPDKNGTLPLYWACRLHEPDIVKLFLNYGADPNYNDNGQLWAYRCVQRRLESGNEAERQKANEIWNLLTAKGAKSPS